MFTVSDLDRDVQENLIYGLLKKDDVPFSIKLKSDLSSSLDDQFSFSKSWIGRSEEARQSTLLLKLLDASSGSEKVSIAQDIVRSMLREVATTIKDESLRNRYLDSSLSQRELIKVLEYCDTPSLLKFTEKVCELSDGSSEVKEFVKSKLDNVFRVSTEGEKASILSMLLKSNIPHKESFIAEGLRSAETHKELAKLIKVTGQDKLISLANDEVTNIVAQGLFGETLRRLRLPKAPNDGANEEAHKKFVSDLRSTIEKAQKSLEGDTVLSNTNYGKEYLSTLDYFLEEASKISSNDSKALLSRISISFRYGIKLTDSTLGMFGVGAKWSVDELNDVEKALKKLPEGVLLTTPLLFELQRVQSIGPNILGARYADGVIRIADLAIKHPGVEDYYPGIGSLQLVLIHEIGHGIQLGESYGRVDSSGDLQPTIDDGDDRMDFDEFLGVSGWRVIQRDRWEVTKENKLLVDGKEYEIRTPVELDGQRIILTFSKGELFAISADAKFSFDNYAKTNPWEDYAEAFSEYFLMPKRLLQYAPDKFKFFEEEFGVYGDTVK